MSDKRRWPLIGAGVPLGLLLLLVAAWGIDSIVSSDQAVRGVTVDGTNLGGLNEADIVNVAADLTTRLSNEALTINAGDVVVTTDLVSVGASIDGERLASEALAARRGGFVLFRPFGWVGTFFSDEELEVNYLYDADAADVATVEDINPLLAKPTDPSIELKGNKLVVVPGSDGSIVEPGVLAQLVPPVLEGETPFNIDLPVIALRPDVADQDLQAVADEANNATTGPIVIEVLGEQTEFEGEDIRPWISLVDTNGSPDWTIDAVSAAAALQPLFPTLGAEGQQPTFDVIDGVPVILPAAESVVCCDESISDLLKAGLLAERPTEDPETGETALRSVKLEPSISDGGAGVEALEALGIIEEISTFTTKHDCCENRVTNIQLMAQIVQGYIIRPGESFSLNDVVGRRTTAGGFKAAGAIANGVLEAQVGGGVSQFTTTLFNAAFFGGMDLDEYQSHSLYFSRYPKGREATISFPKPDFIISNPTEYGILVWPTWTGTTITVTLYSTKNVEVYCVASDGSLVSGPSACDKTISHSSQGECNRWTTRRERVFANGDVENDKVFAVYRPGKGLDCAGNSTVPTTTDPDATTTTVEGETTTTAEGETTTTVEGETTTTVETTTTTVETTTTTTTDP